ncbi:DUF488 domain-containing protein [Microbacterium deminutum]|uniref:DUF488 family protein n=1 Tax=Microbacterium deminutum TaxID=344164 RepID=A0ABN2QQW1_9MICO
MELRLKRVYDDPSADDGWRVLVDRLWPRGLTRQRAALDEWAKEVAPSAELRKAWHTAEPAAWDAYADDYRAELAGPSAAALAELRDELSRHPLVTLVFAAHDPARNHVVVLREALEG